MLDENTHIGAVVIALMAIFSGVRVLINHFFGKTKFGEILGKIIDFGSGNVEHK